MTAPLPVRDGVGPSTVLLPAGNWHTVLAFLIARFADVAPAIWQRRIARGDVRDEHGEPVMLDTPYQAGICVCYYRELDDEPEIPFEASVIYRDEHVLIADKPHFLPVTPSGRFLHQTLLVRLKKAYGLDELVPLHRIDRGTAGLVLFSLNPTTRGLYQSLFPRREIQKVYRALAPSVPTSQLPVTRRSRMVEGEPFFRMREVEGTPNSETHIAELQRFDQYSLYALEPVTGKKHQLRVHLAALGAPILNDRFYPDVLPDAVDDFERPLKLLAYSLAYIDPLTRRQQRFESSRTL